MTPQQIALVQRSWQEVKRTPDAAAQLFYERLFTLDPALQPLFRGDMREQGRKLVTMINVAVNGLSRLETIVPPLEVLGRRHAGYGVKDHHYDTVASALLWTLGMGLGERFTPEVRQAWVTAYGLLATTMKNAARMPQAA